jgi:hypothetical protein
MKRILFSEVPIGASFRFRYVNYNKRTICSARDWKKLELIFDRDTQVEIAGKNLAAYKTKS